MEYIIKFKLIDHYLKSDQNQILTIKELQEWALHEGYDNTQVKIMNMQLVYDGILRERKKPFLFYQIIDS